MVDAESFTSEKMLSLEDELKIDCVSIEVVPYAIIKACLTCYMLLATHASTTLQQDLQSFLLERYDTLI